MEKVLLLQKYWKELLTGFKISLNLILTPMYDLHKKNSKIGYFYLPEILLTLETGAHSALYWLEKS